MEIDGRRVRQLNRGDQAKGPVIYWMSRDQRMSDNWAMLFARNIAQSKGTYLVVAFCLVPTFLGAAARHYDFMLAGLIELEGALSERGIPFRLLVGDPLVEVPGFVEETQAALVVSDFDPLRTKRAWREGVAEVVDVPFYEVDAHNIVPCREASGKQEYAAYTLRPRINRKLEEFLVEFPALEEQKETGAGRGDNDWGRARESLDVDESIGAVSWMEPGEEEAGKVLEAFVNERLPVYGDSSNDPMEEAQSNLSPYLHFGQISAQRVALEVRSADAARASKDAFLEELVVRRELSDNFCLYNESYESLDGFPRWARATLDAHRDDERPYLYTREALEAAKTHDDLWNAAQLEMIMTGKMHGYLRMYWAKKILEWTGSPEDALAISIYLNDRYELDGRDPNGYAGVAWSIGGVHDRAFKERAVFGKVRYMSYEGCKRKFDVRAYVEKIAGLDGEAG